MVQALEQSNNRVSYFMQQFKLKEAVDAIQVGVGVGTMQSGL